MTGDAVVSIGPVSIAPPVVLTWVILLILFLVSWLSTRRLALQPGAWQVIVEGVVGAIDDGIRAALPQGSRQVLPFIGTLWLFITVSNFIGLVPGLHAPTAELSVTAALAVLVFLSVHWYGIRLVGWRTYLAHYVRPNPVLLPFHLIGEITRTVALAVRLFGNMMSMETAVLMMVWVAGLFAPVPLLLLHVIEGLVQAYIFGMLALVYIAGALQAQQLRAASREE